MGQTASERWQILDLVIDAGSRSVTRGNTTIALPNLSFLFLLELVRAAPQVLSADDLMERVWKGVFVNSETVTQRAKLLRDALGDDHSRPRYFSVRRGIGYQLIPEAVRLSDSLPRSGASRLASRKALASAIAAGLMIAGVAGGLAYVQQKQEATKAAPIRVAVLPFDNLSTDPADAYIAQGIPEMVLNRLSTVPQLAVISRESALLSKAAKTDPEQTGKQLEADYVVRGSVQKSGSTLRVTSFVLDTRTGTRLWSQSFDWPVDKLYALQDRIAEQIAGSLLSRAASSGKLLGTPAKAANSDAYLAYLKGKAMLGRFRVADTEAAAKQFQRAVDLDPAFAPAMVALFDARMQAASLRSEDLEPVRRRYQPLLDKALSIDPDSGAALFARAMWSSLPREERLVQFEKAAQKDPSNSRGLTAWAQFLEWGGQDGPPRVDAARIMERVMAIDPLSADAQFWAVQRDVANRRPEEIEAAQRRALELDPGNVLLANRYAVRRWRLNGQTAEAIGLMEAILATDPEYARNAHVAFAMYLDIGDLAAARSVAASTPATVDSTRSTLALYSGDWHTAGEAALGPRGFMFNHFENWLWPEAVRDYALRGGQLGRGTQAIASRFSYELSNPSVTSLYQIPASVPLAQLLLAQGKTELANRLLSQTIRWLDDHPKLGLGGGTGRTKAGALLLLGNRDQALSVLLATTGSAHDVRHCWYLTEWDPVWEPVRKDPRFIEVARLCSESIKSQRGLVEAARRAGKVPSRDR